MADDGKAARATSTSGPFGGVYLITVIGAAVYFVEAADGFWSVVLGLLKALVWPAFAVYRALELLNL